MKSVRLSILVVLALLSVLVLAGCVNNAQTSTTPTTPTTPAAPAADPVDDLTGSDDLTGISTDELDDLQSDFDELDADISGVSETDI